MDVPEVGCVEPVVGEDTDAGLVDPREPEGLRVKGVLDSEIGSAISRE